MIILPNSFERYIAALRIYVSASILKHGLLKKHLKALRAIYIAEAFLESGISQSVDLKKLCLNLLGAVSAINTDFTYKCDTHGNYLINKRLITILLLKLSQNSRKIEINYINNKILITSTGQINNSLAVIKTLEGCYYKDLKANKSLIAIPAFETAEKSVKIESEWQNIFDSFSPVNIFFNRIV